MTEFVKLVDALHGRATIMVALAPTVAAIGLWQGKRKSLQQNRTSGAWTVAKM